MTTPDQPTATRTLADCSPQEIEKLSAQFAGIQPTATATPRTIEQAAQECAERIDSKVRMFTAHTGALEDFAPTIAAAMREVCKPLQHQLRERTRWQCACGGTDCAGQVENERLRAALDVAEGALEHYTWLPPSGPARAVLALARIAEARK